MKKEAELGAEVPMKKGAVLTERIMIAVDPELKRAVDTLREKGVNTAEWIRGILRREILKVKERVA